MKNFHTKHLLIEKKGKNSGQKKGRRKKVVTAIFSPLRSFLILFPEKVRNLFLKIETTEQRPY